MGWYQINPTYQVKQQILLVIRLARTGRRNQPKFRVVVAEHSKPIDGNTVEIVGHFDPTAPDKSFVVDKEAVSKWIKQGARPSNRVSWLLNKYAGFDLPVEQRPPRKPKKEVEEGIPSAKLPSDNLGTGRMAGSENQPEVKPEASKVEGGEDKPAEVPAEEVKAEEPAAEPEAPKEPAEVPVPEQLTDKPEAQSFEARGAKEEEQSEESKENPSA